MSCDAHDPGFELLPFSRRWPKNVVPYELDDKFRFIKKDRALIEQAMKEWQVFMFSPGSQQSSNEAKCKYDHLEMTV